MIISDRREFESLRIFPKIFVIVIAMVFLSRKNIGQRASVKRFSRFRFPAGAHVPPMRRYPVVDRYPVGINSVFEAWDALDIVMAGHVLVRRIVKDHNGRLEFNMPGRPLHGEY